MYVFVIYLLLRLNKVDDKWLRHKKKEEIPVYEVRKPIHKNIYYNVVNNDVENNNNFESTNDVKTNWKNAESSDIFYEQDKIDMNMFRDDKKS